MPFIDLLQAAGYGFSIRQLHVLFSLQTLKGANITEISKDVNAPRQLVTNDLVKLVKFGYVVEDPEHVFNVTPQGVELLTKLTYACPKIEDGPGERKAPEEEPS